MFASIAIASHLRTAAQLVVSLVAACALQSCGDGEPTGSERHTADDGKAPCARPAPLECDGRCVDPERDGSACGACGIVCAEAMVCSRGQCAAECAGLYPDECGRSCVDLRGDPANCGGCGNQCAVGELCTGGVCSRRCGAYAPDQCGELCVDLRSDVRFCGSCEQSCNEGELCVDGVCAGECSGSRPLECQGTCVDPLSDPRFCGSCDRHCSIDEVCSDGRCVAGCSEPTPTFCGGLCVDTTSDARACGRCGEACSPGAVCSLGVCASECLGGTQKCGDECAAVAADPQHCGRCNAPCPEGQLCSGGECDDGCSGETPVPCGSRCVAVEESQGCSVQCLGSTPSLCGSACVDLSRDVEHCGACDAACAAGQSCVDSRCELNCGGLSPDRCAERCVDLHSDLEHCGQCGLSCELGQQCVAGKCQPLCMAPAAQVCAGACADLAADERNCGSCGNLCSVDEYCDEGDCAPAIVDIAAGDSHSCLRLSTNEIWCAGYNGHQQLGGAVPLYDYASVRLASLSLGAVELAAGPSHNCAIVETGELVCWGANWNGQLARDSSSLPTSGEPVVVEGLGGQPVDLALHYAASCALTSADQIMCWGATGTPTLGRNENASPGHVPGPVYGLPTKLAAVECGGSHCCARRQQPSTSIYCWGYSGEGQTGSITAEPVLATEVPSLPPLDDSWDLESSFAAGGAHTCAIAGAGDVYCWGANWSKQLGFEADAPQPVSKLSLPQPALAIYAGWGATCAIMQDRKAMCWGNHQAGGLYSYANLPQVVVDEPVRKLAIGNGVHFALLDSRRTLSWGGSGYLLRRDPVPLYVPRRCCTEP